MLKGDYPAEARECFSSGILDRRECFVPYPQPNLKKVQMGQCLQFS